MLERYLQSLPAGIDSYPECQTRGIIVRSAVKEHAPKPAWSTLPLQLRELIHDPPLPTTWVPAVLSDAMFCVLVDTYYPTKQAIFTWNHDRTSRLSRSTAYRMLTRATSLRTFLRSAARVHEYFQRGTNMRVELHEKTGGTFWLEHPPYLHCELNHYSNEAVFQAVLETAGVSEPLVRLVEVTPRHGKYEAQWKL